MPATTIATSDPNQITERSSLRRTRRNSATTSRGRSATGLEVHARVTTSSTPIATTVARPNRPATTSSTAATAAIAMPGSCRPATTSGSRNNRPIDTANAATIAARSAREVR
jgi:hypothetical protein